MNWRSRGQEYIVHTGDGCGWAWLGADGLVRTEQGVCVVDQSIGAHKYILRPTQNGQRICILSVTILCTYPGCSLFFTQLYIYTLLSPLSLQH